MSLYEEYDVLVLSYQGFLYYFFSILVGSVSCCFVLRWTTSDSYNLPAFKNKKRLHFGSNLSDADSLSFYRVREIPTKKK
ncbi:hypothetical protein CRE_26201 [Caenorhabditis remanei]|uniref:Uncharacterized protein n=2 Tax=Caenorhabditis remanei TaxID=31234 RepID=E3LQR1_CAERE|nr:hypothetical protein CRE_26201 [Caenorhabditis remanei]